MSLFNRPLVGQSVAVRTIEREWNSQVPSIFWETRSFKVVKVKEVHPNGLHFLDTDGNENDSADIIRSFR